MVQEKLIEGKCLIVDLIHTWTRTFQAEVVTGAKSSGQDVDFESTELMSSY